MFDSLIEAAQEFWDDVKIDDFCVPCFVKGLAKGAAIGLTTLLVIASLPAAVATAVAVVLTVVGVAGAAVLAARWKNMTGAERSETLGDLAGGLLAGGIGLARPPPGIQLLSASAADGSTVLIPVLATSEAPASAGAAAGTSVGAATAGATVLSTGGGDSTDGSDDDTSYKEPARSPKPDDRTRPSGQLGGSPTGKPTRIPPGADKATTRSLQRENESADLLAKNGYRVEQNPQVPDNKNPDYLIEGRRFDCKAPSTARARNSASEISDAVNDGQADRIVLNMEDTPLSTSDMKQQLSDYPIEGLKEVIAIKDGQIVPLWP